MDALVGVAQRLLRPKPAEAVALLALVAGQDVEPAEDSASARRPLRALVDRAPGRSRIE